MLGVQCANLDSDLRTLSEMWQTHQSTRSLCPAPYSSYRSCCGTEKQMRNALLLKLPFLIVSGVERAPLGRTGNRLTNKAVQSCLGAHGPHHYIRGFKMPAWK